MWEALNNAADQYAKTRDPQTRERVAELAQPFVRAVWFRRTVGLPRHIDRDDLLSAANMGLLKAIERFTGNNGCSFVSYAQHRIRGSILDEIDTRNRQRHPSIIGIEATQEDEREPSVPDTTRAVDHKDTWRHVSRGMSRRERLCCKLLYGEQLPAGEVAKAVGVVESRVYQMVNNVRDRLKSTRCAEVA